MTLVNASVTRCWIKSSPSFAKMAQKVATGVFTEKVSKIQAIFERKTAAITFQKIAQSGHTAPFIAFTFLRYLHLNPPISIIGSLVQFAALFLSAAYLKCSVTRSGDFWTLCKFLKPLATINLPNLPTFLGNFCKGVKIYHFCIEIIFRQLLQTLGDFLWSHCQNVTVYLPTYLPTYLLVVDNWNQYCKILLLVTDGPVMNYFNDSCCGWGRAETAERQSFPTPQINSSNPVIGNFYYVFGNCTDETRAGECSIF